MRFLDPIRRPFGNCTRTIKRYLRARRDRADWDCIAMHRHEVTRIPPSLLLPLVAGPVKGKLSCPDNLTILLLHNYERTPLTEQSLRYAGIDNFFVQRFAPLPHWSNSRKIVEIRKFLESEACTTDYLLYLDADDIVLRDDPAKAIDLLEEQEGCEILFSNTSFRGDYEAMPETRKWADSLVEGRKIPQPYLNAGAFISTTSFLRELMEAAMEFVTDDDLSRSDYQKLRRSGKLLEALPDFPRGVGCDQVILRYLQPRFHPRMKIDYHSQLAIR